MDQLDRPDNKSLPIAQRRARIENKLAHLKLRLTEMRADRTRARLIPHAENEIKATQKRLEYLNQEAAQGAGE